MLITGGRHPYLGKYKVSRGGGEGLMFKYNIGEKQRAASGYSLMGVNKEQINKLCFNFFFLVLTITGWFSETFLLCSKMSVCKKITSW